MPSNAIQCHSMPSRAIQGHLWLLKYKLIGFIKRFQFKATVSNTYFQAHVCSHTQRDLTLTLTLIQAHVCSHTQRECAKWVHCLQDGWKWILCGAAPPPHDHDTPHVILHRAYIHAVTRRELCLHMHAWAMPAHACMSYACTCMHDHEQVCRDCSYPDVYTGLHSKYINYTHVYYSCIDRVLSCTMTGSGWSEGLCWTRLAMAPVREKFYIITMFISMPASLSAPTMGRSTSRITYHGSNLSAFTLRWPWLYCCSAAITLYKFCYSLHACTHSPIILDGMHNHNPYCTCGVMLVLIRPSY